MVRKTSLFVLLLVATLLSCKDKEEECVAPSIEKNIIGTWKAVHKDGADTYGPYNVTFKADGTLTGAAQLLVDEDIDDADLISQTWEVINGALVVTFEEETGTVPLTLTVKENTCNKINLNLTLLNSTVELSK